MKKRFLLCGLLTVLTSCNVTVVETSLFMRSVDDIEVHSDLVKEFYAQEKYDYSDLSPYVTAKDDLGDNLPVHLSWNGHTNLDKKIIYDVSIYEGEKEYISFKTEKSEYDFYNYKLDEEYTIEVALTIDDEVHEEVSTSFVTPKGKVRTITVDGVNNFRDLGRGVKIKQGFIYRSATLENNTVIDEDNPISISEEGKKQVASLKLKSEIDLRKEDEKGIKDKSILDLNYFDAGLYYGGQNILTYKNSEYDNPKTIKNILEFLADEKNYPVVFHCVRGTDRTGFLAFVIKGLLGVEEEELKRDFIFSNFYNIGSPVKLDSIEYTVNPNAVTRYVNVFKQTEGDTLQQKIYNYLSGDKIGVSQDNLNSIINILKK